MNLLYVNLSLGTWFKPSCHYCTVILIHPEQKAIIFIELAKVEVHFYVKESLIIYRNYALLYVDFMKYFYLCFSFKTILDTLKIVFYVYESITAGRESVQLLI